MAVTSEEQALLRRLRKRLDRDIAGYVDDDGLKRLGFKQLKAYKRGMQRLVQLGIAVPEQLQDFVTIVAWPGTLSDSIVARLKPQGFTLNGEVDEAAWKIWQANAMDKQIRMALADMVDYGRGYLCVGTRESGKALLTAESPFQLAHEWSARDNRVSAAARFYVDDSSGKRVSRATLYQPNVTKWLLRDRSGWIEDPDIEPDEHRLGRVMVHPLVNRASSDDAYGISELLPILGITDAAARALTDAQVATEVMAIPQRHAAGLKPEDFKDPKTGLPLTTWEAYFGAIWATANKDAKFGQFSAADLNNFKTIWSLYAQAASGLTGLPMRYLGQLSDNPPSADGIRADEARLVGTAEDKQLFADDPIEAAMRDALALEGTSGDFDALETVWRNAATPTLAQAADAAVKLRSEGIISRRQAQRDMGYTPTQIQLMEQEMREEQPTSAFEELALERARAALEGLNGGDANPGAGA